MSVTCQRKEGTSNVIDVVFAIKQLKIALNCTC